MNVRRPRLIALSPLALAGAAALTPGQAASPSVDPGAFAHCASMTVADERLACYDSLSRPKSSATPAAPAASAAPSASSTAKAGPQTATMPAAANTAAPAASAVAADAAAAGAAGAPEAKSFGLTRHPAPAEQGLSQIQAKVTRVDMDRIGDVRVSLDNGQAWTFYSFNAVLRVGETVTIKRGAVGSFLLTTASHHTYHAVRAQ